LEGVEKCPISRFQGGSTGSNPVGDTRSTTSDKAGYRAQSAGVSLALPPGTREGRRNSRQCRLRQSSKSADIACPKMGLRAPAELCCREVGPRLEPQGPLASCNYRDATGKHHSETKTRLVDAERRKAEIEVALATVTWRDPRRGELSLAEWAVVWLPTRLDLRPTTWT
jgi:hypothetical protein